MIQTGLTCKKTITVTPEMTAAAMGSGALEVLATPSMIALMEGTAQEAARSAVCKINIDSDIRLAMTGTVRKYLTENPADFDPRKYLKAGRDAIEAMVRHKIVDVLGSSGKAE